MFAENGLWASCAMVLGLWAAALALDLLLGEPRRAHPLVAFGRLTIALEQRFNSGARRRLKGAIALMILVMPLLLIAAGVQRYCPSGWREVIAVLVLWSTLSWRGLVAHAWPIARALEAGDLALARRRVGMIVSRKADALDAKGVATAATESVLENGADAIFASLFWFAVAGLPGVVLHRAVNTLDAMWGYRTERFHQFGYAAARLDDLLNWLPARLTALSYVLVGHTATAWQCWRTQAAQWDSPNAGPVMAAGAGALRVALGGPALYADGIHQRPPLGQGDGASAASIDQAVALVNRSIGLWLGVMGVMALLMGWP